MQNTFFNSKLFAVSCAKADSSEELMSLLEKTPFLDDLKYWRNYGDMPNNEGLVNGQNNHSDSALIELIQNSFDSVLTLECEKYGVDPESKHAPKTKKEAIEAFFEFRDGTILSLGRNELVKLNSENRIQFIFTGNLDKHKKDPNIIIVDDGEGQTPKKAPDTILSLAKNNKQKINFVQGRYNQGGSGVASFCKNGLQVMLFKRNKDAFQDTSDETSDLFGFTIVRRFEPDELSNMLGYKVKNPEYRYLVDGENNIISFESKSGLEIIPKVNGNVLYYNEFNHGLFRKLFDYTCLHQANRMVSPVAYRINALITEAVWPVSFRDTRAFTLKNRDRDNNKIIPGLLYSIKEDKEREGVIYDAFEESLIVDGTKFNIKYCIYNESQDLTNRLGNKKKSEIEGILFVENGQVHGTLKKSVLNSSEIGLGFIADNTLIIVDCTGIGGTARSRLFSPNRENFKDTDFSRLVLEQIKETIKENEKLKEAEHYFKQKAIRNNPRVDHEKVIGRLNKQPGFLEALADNKKKLKKVSIKNGSSINNGSFNTEKVASRGKGKSKRLLDHPEYFKLKSEDKKIYVKRGNNIRINFATNAKDNYFTRPISPGKYAMRVDADIKKTSMNLKSGDACLIVVMDTSKYMEGESLKFKVIVGEEEGVKFYNELDVIFTNNYVKKEQNQNPQKSKSNDKIDESGSTNRKNGASFKASEPEFIEVYKEDWHNWKDMDEMKAACVVSSEGNVTIAINADFKYLNTEKKNQKTKLATDSIHAAYVENTQISAYYMLSYYNSLDNSEMTNKIEEILNSTAISRLYCRSKDDIKVRESAKNYQQTRN